MFSTYLRLNLATGATDREVVRAAMSKLMPRARFHHAYREARHGFLRDMLDYHHGAQRLHHKVMTGDFS